MKGRFITFEGTEGSGKSTQISLLAERLLGLGFVIRSIREPGGTPIGEEIRFTLKHSKRNAAMTAETELLLMNASRAQIVREVIRPALEAGEIVLCDRFYDSTIAYQGYGRGMDLAKVRQIVDFAVGETCPDLTLLLHISTEMSEQRRRGRQATFPIMRDRFEESDRAFFARVAEGYESVLKADPGRVRKIDAAGSVEAVRAAVWREVGPLFPSRPGN
jgi:dTMP kinase